MLEHHAYDPIGCVMNVSNNLIDTNCNRAGWIAGGGIGFPTIYGENFNDVIYVKTIW